MALTKVTGKVVKTSTDLTINNITGVAATFTGNVTIGGTLTYQDVTNIDAVGIITAQTGIHLGIGATAGKMDALTGISTFSKVGIGISNPITTVDIKVTDTATYEADEIGVGQNQLRINNAGASGVAGIRFDAEPSSGSAGYASIRTIAPASGSADLIFSTRNSSTFGERVRITSAGKVGINTTSIPQQLTVFTVSGYPILAQGPSNGIGLGNNGAIVFGNKTLGSYAKGILDATELEVKISGTPKVNIDSSGRVLIGTTTEGGVDADNLTVADSGNAGITIRSGTGNSGNLYFSDATSGAAEYDGAISYNQSSQYMDFYTAQAPRLRITSGGAVMINTTNSSSRTLNLKGTFGILSPSQTGVIDMSVTDAGEASIGPYVAGGSALVLKTNASGSGVAERLRINSSGNIAIGSGFVPGRHVHIKDAGIIKLENTTTGGWIGLEFLGSSGTNNYDGYMGLQDSDGLFFIDNNSNGIDFCITQGGNLGVTGTTGTDFSLLDGMVVNTANGLAGVLINSSSSSHNAYLGFSYGSGSSTSHADQFSAYLGRVGDNQLVFGTNNVIRGQVSPTGGLQWGLPGSSSSLPGATGALNVRALANGNLHVRASSDLQGGTTGVGLDVLNDAGNTVQDLVIRGATTYFRNASAETLRIDSNGMFKFTRGSTGTVGHFYANARECNILLQNDAQTWKIVNYDYGNNGTDNLGFHNGSSDIFVIGTNGCLGAGVTQPTEAFHLLKSHNGHTRMVIQNNWGANATAQLKLISPTDEFQIVKYASGSAQMSLSNNSTIITNIGGAERLKVRGDSTGQTTHLVCTPSPGGNGVDSQYVTQVYAMSGNYTNFRVTVTATSWHSFFLKIYVSGYSGHSAYRWVTGYCNNGFGTIRHVHSYDGGNFGSGTLTHISGQSWRYDLSVNSGSTTHPVMHVELSLGGNGNIRGNGAVVCAIT